MWGLPPPESVVPPALVCMCVRVEVTGEFLPHVSATDTFVVHPVGHAVDCDLHFGDVGVEVAVH